MEGIEQRSIIIINFITLNLIISPSRITIVFGSPKTAVILTEVIINLSIILRTQSHNNIYPSDRL